MVKPPRRTFTLRDAIVLVAANAIVFAWLRSLEDIEVLDRLQDWLQPAILGLILTPLTLAIVGLRLLPLSALKGPDRKAQGAALVVPHNFSRNWGK